MITAGIDAGAKSVKILIMKDNKIICGFLPLTPPLEEHHFGAYVEVSVLDCKLAILYL